MSDAAKFTIADNWHGGCYELAVEVGRTSDERLGRCLEAVWRAAGVHGCYGRDDLEPEDQQRVSLTLESLRRYGHLRGLVDLPNGVRMVCGAVAVREDDGPDWLCFYLPIGALGRAEQRMVGSYPYEREGDPPSIGWRAPIDAWLAGVAREVYATVGFRLALIGPEVSGHAYAGDLGDDPGEPRYLGYLIPRPDGLRHLPATR
ncbi:hypothetical protein [Actinoplanes sp. NPDC051494]|uniref:hypothetical protein n=1 Tax=Actinoplanes sp. NPDC051494 TaxID=3363907 RepID=UPI0037A29456